MEVELYADTSKLESDMRQLAYLTGKSYGQTVKATARGLAVNLAYNTQPYGDSDSARLSGQNAVMRDINRAYITPQAVFIGLKNARVRGKQTALRVAKTFISACLSGNIDRAQKILKSAGVPTSNLNFIKWDAGAYHQRNRNNRGRVAKNTQPVIVIGVQNRLDAYKKKIMGRVGMAKSGWAAAARDLGGARGIPQWAKRNKNVGSAIDNTDQSDNPHAILRNDARHLRGALNSGQMHYAVVIAQEKLTSQVAAVTRWAARKSGL